MYLQDRIVDYLIKNMKFKQQKDWLRQGVCPQCSEKGWCIKKYADIK